MIYYYIYSIYIYLYINTYINILHVHPILKRGEERTQKTYEDVWRWGQGGEPKVAHCEDRVSSHCVFFFLALHTGTCVHTHTHSRLGDYREVGKHSSVAPVGGAAVAGLAALGFLLHAAGLTALTRTTLSVLREVMMQQLGVGLLVRR